MTWNYEYGVQYRRKHKKRIATIKKAQYSKKRKDILCRQRKKRRTKIGRITTIYCGQNQRMGTSYSLNQLTEWVVKQKKYHIMWKKWKESGYKNNLSPSIDRIDNQKGYSLDNIQLMTWKENNTKGRLEYSKKIIQKDKNGNILKVWQSAAIAQKHLGIWAQNISHVANKIRNYAGGYKWEFQN